MDIPNGMALGHGIRGAPTVLQRPCSLCSACWSAHGWRQFGQLVRSKRLHGGQRFWKGGGGKGIGFDKMDVFFPCILIYGYDRYVQISWICCYLWTVFVLCWSHLDLVTLMVKLFELVVWIDPATTNYTHVVSGGFQVSTTFVDTMFNSCSGRRAKLSMFLISDYCVLCFRFFVVFQFEQWK